MRVLTVTSSVFVVALGALPLASPGRQEPQAVTQAARPRRTEAEARQLAERHRQEREKLQRETGKPVVLISTYVKAVIGPVPESLGVSPFYKKSTRSASRSWHRKRSRTMRCWWRAIS